MRTVLYISVTVVLAGTSCTGRGPTRWDGPQLTQPRDCLTVEQLLEGEVPSFLDMSYLARPDWADSDPAPFMGSLELTATPLEMDFPRTREL